MKVLQLIVISVVYVILVVHGARWTDAPLWLVSIVIIGPFVWWLYAPLFRRRPVDLREDERGCPPSLLDLLLEQTPHYRRPDAERVQAAASIDRRDQPPAPSRHR